ncbi:hypothetical protein GT034_16740 [Streptomyces sp. SID2563]|uniref:hypothetical protein n=1 Tax=Streptomyces sp. SID2563 TaxID=2690255 RepID=UPI00136B50AB|nr:hypothetical protein [Streptomyces sp. SID2563]MYW09986.1 hypothetical protein [Streptomyces sp. SID2563]
MPDTPELWTRGEVADYLGIAPDSVRRQLSRRKIRRAGTGESAAGRITALYNADQVRAARAARTDFLQ